MIDGYAGFTPYYTAVTWYGYDQNESINYNKRNPAGLLWANVMSRVHTGLKSAKFEKPNTVTSCIICAETGKKATTGCKNTYTEYFLWLTEPGLCDKHTGSELKDNTNNTSTQNKVQEIIEGITQDIDAVDPQQMLPNNFENTTNTVNTDRNSNIVNRNTNIVKNNTNTTNNSTVNTTRTPTNNSSNSVNTTNSQTTNNSSNTSQTNNSSNVNSTNTSTNTAGNVTGQYTNEID